MSGTHSWDPERYLMYADERGRPFVELLARVGAGAPDLVVDLGCGPGNLTRLLADRWPGARVVGVDASTAMVALLMTASTFPNAMLERLYKFLTLASSPTSVWTKRTRSFPNSASRVHSAFRPFW